jgi:hypothetical protein
MSANSVSFVIIGSFWHQLVRFVLSKLGKWPNPYLPLEQTKSALSGPTGLGLSVGRGPTTSIAEDAVEELFENFATELESVVRKYAPRLKQLYKSVKDPQKIDASIDYTIARLIRALEHETRYYFDVASVNNIEDYLERRIITGVDE